MVELKPLHGEVIPTSLLTLAALGVRNATAVARRSSRFDLPHLCAAWGMRVAWVDSLGMTLRDRSRVLFFQSAEYLTSTQLREALPRNNVTMVLLGCHNAKRCNPLYSTAAQRPRTVVVHWHQRTPSLLPYFLGPVASEMPMTRDVLIPGGISQRRRACADDPRTRLAHT